MTVAIKVWGEWACFTRPELGVERVSYPVPTPSAARGIIEAVYWHPGVHWQVRSIAVLRPIRWAGRVTNEVKSWQSITSARKWAAAGRAGHDVGFYVEEDRTQRHSLLLRDVAYVFETDAVCATSADETKALEIFERRLSRGQCFTRPYLGTRECVAFLSTPLGTELPINRTEPLGRMLFDLRWSQNGTEPIWMDAELHRGVLHVPPELYRQQRAPRAA